jgi:Tol biopolymer transport system component
LPLPGASDPAYSETSPSWSFDNQWLVFSSDQYGNYDIFKIPAGGGAAVRLTTDPSHESFPSWSPDGARILFERQVGGGSEIWVMNADGTNQQQLTSGYKDGTASFSPDGTKILFHGWRPPTSDLGIFVMNSDGSGITWLGILGAHPKWSRDGSEISFEQFYNFATWVMNADGSGAHACTPRINGSNDGGGGIDWSPAACRFLAYTVSPYFQAPATQSGLSIIDATLCAGPTQILPFGSGVQHPAWSNDGLMMAFTRFDGTGNDIYVMGVCSCPDLPLCSFQADDTNCDGVVDVFDVIETIDVTFNGKTPHEPCCKYQ